MSSVFFMDCQTLTFLGIFLLIIALLAIVFNSFPLYTLLGLHIPEFQNNVQAFAKTVRAFLVVLVFVDLCGSMFTIPMYLLTELGNDSCGKLYFLENYSEKVLDILCGSSYTIYFTYKLTSLFLITFTSYSSYLYFNNTSDSVSCSGKIYKKNPWTCEGQASMTTTASTISDHKSVPAAKIKEEKSNWAKPLLFIIGFIFLISFLISVLPITGLGPLNLHHDNTTVRMMSNESDSSLQVKAMPSYPHICSLASFSEPAEEKEFIFLFFLLMASFGCVLLLLYICVALYGNMHTKASFQILGEMTQLTNLQAFLYMCTWTPVLVSITN